MAITLFDTDPKFLDVLKGKINNKLFKMELAGVTTTSQLPIIQLPECTKISVIDLRHIVEIEVDFNQQTIYFETNCRKYTAIDMIFIRPSSKYYYTIASWDHKNMTQEDKNREDFIINTIILLGLIKKDNIC